MRTILLAIAAMIVSLPLAAQSSETDLVVQDSLKITAEPIYDIIQTLDTPAENGGKAELIVPAEVGVMMQSHILQNKKAGQYTGYRIQIMSVNSSQKDIKELEAIRDKFEEDFTDIPAYLIYTVPDFKIRVGNYRNKLESIPDLHRVRRLYPDSYSVKCTITDKEMQHEPLGIRRERQLRDSLEALNAAELLYDANIQ